MSNMEDNKTDSKKKGKCSNCLNWIGSPSFYLLCNFMLSQWGDWMWQFAVGMYLVHLADKQLRLAAIFGFCGGGCVLLFGGIIGDWVDRNGRLKVVRISLFIQNLSVAMSSVCVCVVLALSNSHYSAEMESGSVGRFLIEAAIVVLAIIAQLSSVAYKIAIEKDWIVVIASGKSSVLANLNAVTRTLDLMCKIVSPLTVGFIMSYGSLLISAIVIAGWNLVSVFIEYALLSHIYQLVPELATKKLTTENADEGSKETELQQLKTNNEINTNQSNLFPEDIEVTDSKSKETEAMNSKEPTSSQPDQPSCIGRVFEPFIVLVRGWKTYARQSVVYASISLACLYMTVLGFDSITIGYIYANQIDEAIVGICMGLAGVTGILGALLFTRFHKWFGLEKTGILAYFAEISCLVLAVASVWAPGSLFNPYSVFNFRESANTIGMNISATTEMNRFVNNINSSVMTFDNWSLMNGINETDVIGSVSTETPTKTFHLNVSMLLLLVGIIASRVGLWMADLVVTQLMQESIVETERGIVHGVQNSLNMFMDMLKFVLVIVLPQIEIFGAHIILSFSFICLASLFFLCHASKAGKICNGVEKHKINTNGNMVV